MNSDHHASGLTCEAIARAALREPAKQEGAELLYRCTRPERHKNGDAHPSLKINRTKNTWGCFVCGVGGTPWQLAAFLADHDPSDKEAVIAWLEGKGLLNKAERTDTKIVATYDLRDASGKLLSQEVRLQLKDFRMRRPDPEGGWAWHLECSEKCKCKTKLPAVRRVLYRLQEVLQADSVLVCKGPKDCETGRKLGLVATTNPNGAKSNWLPQFSEFDRGKRVTAIADADVPGLAHGREVACSLLGVAATVKLIKALPGTGVKDLSDFGAIFPV